MCRLVDRFGGMTVVVAAALLAVVLTAEPTAAGELAAAPAGLQPMALVPLPLGKVRPAGWLRRQLEIQAAGLSGHLDEFWPDIRDSAWIGGEAEGWERVPYWLDGIVPLAFLLDDEALQAKAKRSIDYILEHQRPDGWLGPLGDGRRGHQPYDVWPLFPLFKAFIQYEEATGDERIVPALLRAAQRMDDVLAEKPLTSWAKVRVADWVLGLYWLYDRTGEAWLLDAADRAFTQSEDWAALYGGDDTLPARYRLRGTEGFDMTTHGVNTGMGFKYGPVRWRLTGDDADRAAIRTMLDLVDHYHGQANGMFGCDEHLAGRSPAQGTELCTVVETMFSLEQAIAILGDARLGDRLERITFNALPATFDTAMESHQYDQQVNQVICTREGERPFATNGPESNTFGLEPNFGCCTANLHQGWPKFASHLWMTGPEGEPTMVVLAPCVVTTTWRDQPVTIKVETGYPFRDALTLAVASDAPVQMPIVFRVPGWARSIEVEATDLSATIQDGEERLPIAAAGQSRASARLEGGDSRWVRVEGNWKPSSRLTVRLEMPCEVVRASVRDAVTVERGPLLFAYPVPAEWKKVVDRPGLPFDDYDVLPKGAWAHALAVDPARPTDGLVCAERPVGDIPFAGETPPLVVRVQARRVAGWVLERGAAGLPPFSPVRSDEPRETLDLVPYGSSRLRVAMFPWLENP